MTLLPPFSATLLPRDDTRDSRERQARQVQRISEGMRQGRIGAQEGLHLLREQRRISAARKQAEALRKTPGGADAAEPEGTRREELLRQVAHLQELGERAIARAEQRPAHAETPRSAA